MDRRPRRRPSSPSITCTGRSIPRTHTTQPTQWHTTHPIRSPTASPRLRLTTILLRRSTPGIRCSTPTRTSRCLRRRRTTLRTILTAAAEASHACVEVGSGWLLELPKGPEGSAPDTRLAVNVANQRAT